TCSLRHPPTPLLSPLPLPDALPISETQHLAIQHLATQPLATQPLALRHLAVRLLAVRLPEFRLLAIRTGNSRHLQVRCIVARHARLTAVLWRRASPRSGPSMCTRAIRWSVGGQRVGEAQGAPGRAGGRRGALPPGNSPLRPASSR